MLAGKEFDHATVENTIESFKEAILFGPIEEFIQWYTQHMHSALSVDIGKCPQEAVFRKSNPANLLDSLRGASRTNKFLRNNFRAQHFEIT